MIDTLITYLLLLISLVVSLISLAALIRGMFYRPTPKYLSLVITQRSNTQSEWFRLLLQRPWYLRWQPLPRFRAGQSIAITPTGSKTKRRYSLARWQKIPFSYEVTIKREPLGKVSNPLWQEAQVGSRLAITPPSGEFVLKSVDTPLVFIAGGVGITPLLAMLDEYLPKAKRDIPVHLFWQVRHEHEWIYQPELARLQQNHPQLTLHLLVSQPGHSHHPARRININLLRGKLGSVRDYHYYLCASEALIDNLCSALETNGVPHEQIHFERFSIASGGATGVWALDVNGTAITFDGHKTLLDAFEENNIPISSDCRTGSCGECQISITQGQTRSVITPEFVPPTGRILACCCVPESDLAIRVG